MLRVEVYYWLSILFANHMTFVAVIAYENDHLFPENGNMPHILLSLYTLLIVSKSISSSPIENEAQSVKKVCNSATKLNKKNHCEFICILMQ